MSSTHTIPDWFADIASRRAARVGAVFPRRLPFSCTIEAKNPVVLPDSAVASKPKNGNRDTSRCT